jgi:hypothetical protein
MPVEETQGGSKVKREALVVALAGWAVLAFSLWEVISRSVWMSSDGRPLPSSDGVPYGIICGMGLATAGRVLARIEAALEKRDAPAAR